jgi:hypothetical protein
MPSCPRSFVSIVCRRAALAAVVLSTALPVMAQTTREEELATQQAEKAKSTATTRRAWFEQKLLDIEEAGGFGVPRGFFVAFGDIKAGSGLALGPLYAKTFADGAFFQLKSTYSIRNFKMAQAFVQSAPLAQKRVLLNARARWQDAPVLPVYALGTESPRTRADYSETKTEVSGQALITPVRFLKFGAGTGFERFDTGDASSNRPALGDLYTSSQMPGIGADPDYIHSYVSGAIDSRRGPGFSRTGSLLSATYHDYRQRNDGAFSFHRTDAVARQLIPILHGNWVIDLSLRASMADADSGDTVPFFLMPSLGGGRALRGYGNYRFRDRNSILFTGEYRWYVQEFAEMALFYDAGKVTSRRADLDFNDLKSDFGIGLRFHGPQTTIIRAEIARGNEGLRFILSFTPAIP